MRAPGALCVPAGRAPQPGAGRCLTGCSPINFARNSPASTSNIEFMSLGLQRFRAISKSDRGKLCAKCVWGGCVGSLSGQAPPPPTGTAARPRCRPVNFACNSPAACSNIEFASLELQRFLGLLKFVPIELHAKFVWLGSCHRLSNFARNSPATCLDIEVVSLGLQRFHRVSKSDREKLCAKFVWTRPLASNPVRALWILRRTSHLWGLVCCCVG